MRIRWRRLPNEEFHGFAFIVRDQYVINEFLFPLGKFEERTQEDWRRKVFCPEFLAEENHRTERIGRGAIVVPPVSWKISCNVPALPDANTIPWTASAISPSSRMLF